MNQNRSRKEEKSSGKEEKITRKEAMKKAGKYAAFTAASMLTILHPTKLEAQDSPALPPEW